MQATQTQKPPVPAVLFDASLDGDVDQVLALAMLFGLEGRRQVRVASLSTSRFSLRIARFLDLVARFYAGDRPGAVGNPRLLLPAHRRRTRPGAEHRHSTGAGS